MGLPAWQKRKILHILTGPLFILTWPLFTDDYSGALWAASVPFGMTCKFVIIGLGYLKDTEVIACASRSGDRKELLLGPCFYGIVFVAATVLFWKEARAVICLFILCFGDGFAEIGGRFWGHQNKWKHSPRKSLAGSLTFVVAATLSLWLFYCIRLGNLMALEWSFLGRILFDAIIAAIIESLPMPYFDNVTSRFVFFIFDAAIDLIVQAFPLKSVCDALGVQHSMLSSFF
eukprot:scaffold2111_cov167-Ochromonas_danica.AAC.1